MQAPTLEPLRTPEDAVHHRVATGELKPGTYEHVDALLALNGMNRAARRERLRELGVKKRR